MTINGWIQIALYCAVITALAKPVGGYMTRVFAGERTLLSFALRPAGAADLSRQRGRRERRAALADLCLCHAGVFARGRDFALRADEAAGRAAVQSARACGCGSRSVVQHGGELRLQHELAVLRARDDDELSRADGWSHRAQFPFRGDGHRPSVGADPRFRAPFGQERRQFLGRYDPLHALRAAADFRSSWACSSSGRACRRISTRMSRRRPWKARNR